MSAALVIFCLHILSLSHFPTPQAIGRLVKRLERLLVELAFWLVRQAQLPRQVREVVAALRL